MKPRLVTLALMVVSVILSVSSSLAQFDILPLPKQSGNEVLEQQQKLTASDGRPGYTFGAAVALSDDASMILVSDTGLNDQPPYDSKVYVYTLEENSWKENQILEIPDTGYYFGRFLDISPDGTKALVAAYQGMPQPSITGPGIVYAYKRLNNNLWQLEADEGLTPSQSFFDDYFGRYISINDAGSVAVIGAIGKVYIFTHNGTGWVETDIINAPPNSGNFGRSSSISGDGNTIIIGSEVGAYIYQKDAMDEWIFQQELEPQIPHASSASVVSLSSDGNTALINSFQNTAFEGGAAHIFVRGMDGIYTEQDVLVNSDNVFNDGFGRELDLSPDGNTAIIGSIANDELGTDAGAVYVFTRGGTVWTEKQQLLALDGESEDNFGNAVNFAQDKAVVTSPRDDNDLGNNAGSVYVFTDIADPVLPNNDSYDDPIGLVSKQQYNFSERFQNSTITTDPIPQSSNTCPIELPATDTGAIHYEISALSGPLVIRIGTAAWYRRSDGLVGDTAVVVYQVDESDNIIGEPIACADEFHTGAPGVTSAVFSLQEANNYRVVVWRENNAADGAIIEMDNATFDLVSPVDTTISAPGTPLTFSWKPFNNAPLYFFKIVRSIGGEGSLLVKLDPSVPADGLVCTVDLCTFDAFANSEISSFLTVGDYLWSVVAAESEEVSLGTSNQVNRLKIEDTVTPTSTVDPTTPTATPEATETPTETPANNIIINGGFEDDTNTDGIPENWKGNGLLQDKLKCNQDANKEVAYEGDCAFKFGGNTKASLKQTINDVITVAGDTATLAAYVRGKELSASSVKVIFKYSDTEKRKGKLNIASDTIDDYQLSISTPVEMLNGTAKVIVTIKSTSGKLIIDSISVTTSQSLIALPQ